MHKKEYQIMWKENSVIDLHNDLLSYLAASVTHSPYDSATCSSIEQLQRGGVRCLVTVAFTETQKDSEFQLERQSAQYEMLHTKYADVFCPLRRYEDGKIATCFAIENCSAFSSETEPLEESLKRLHTLFHSGIRPLYVSLTWNQENRFGGGAHATAGLKSDGEKLLDAIEGYVTAIDISHASDRLGADILNYLDRSKSSLKAIASHSNFRSVRRVPRNIPDELAQEIAQKGGVIGLTAIRNFIGTTMEDYYRHIEYALDKGLGDALAIGADFFCVPNLSPDVLEAFYQEHFFPTLSDASCLQSVLDEVEKRFGSDVKQKMAWKNAQQKLLSVALT
jgi:microsomal dipeptidase-like Zn-dependent dipeptidase